MVDSSKRFFNSSQDHHAVRGGSTKRRAAQKFENLDRDKFRYNLIHNKMHHMLNDENEKKKRHIMGSRNLNTQAKLMITQPSQVSFSVDELSQIALSPSPTRGKVTLPPVLSPNGNRSTFVTA